MSVNIEQNPDHMHVTVALPVSPEVAFAWWTEGDKLTQWWSEEADVGAAVGGKYVLSWPKMDWTLNGEVLELEAGQKLAFSWAWNHEPDSPTRKVVVTFGASDAGCALDIWHGVYGDSEADQKDRKGHVQGWEYFLPRLVKALS